MLENLTKQIEVITNEKIINLASFQEIKIVSNNETINHIRKLAQETGLPVSRIIEAMIRAALDDLPKAAGIEP